MLRRALMGLAMGLTAIGIIYSPWGQRSGAHMNPAVTLTFLSLGKIAPWDALFYVLFQFLGGIAGVLLASVLIGPPLQHSAVNYVVTAPGPAGPRVAFVAEFVISMLMMSTVLWVSNSRRLSRFTPLFAGTLVATFITFEAPLSGMSMNPARTFGSAFPAGEWTASVDLLSPHRRRPCCLASVHLSLPARRSSRLLRQTSPLQQPTLHLSTADYGDLNAQ